MGISPPKKQGDAPMSPPNSPPRTDAGSIPTSDASAPAPDASADAAVRTDASVRDASASPDAGTRSEAAALHSAPSSAPDAGTRADAGPTRSPWSIELDGFVGSARLGGPNGTLFSPEYSPANEGWNHTRSGVGLG